MIKKHWKDLLLSLFVNLVFVITIFNVTSLEYFSRNTFLMCFYFFWTICMSKLTGIKSLQLILISCLPAILIDVSVIFTNRNLIPFRFPFTTLFTVVGGILGYLTINKSYRWVILISTIFLSGYLLGGKLFLGWVSAKKNLTKSITNNKISIYNDSFINEGGDTITLKESINNKKKVIVDFYFIGCLPCIAKENALQRLNEISDTTKFQIVLICANMPHYKFDDFVKQEKKVTGSNVIYLYDYQEFTKSKLQIQSFPYEINLNEDKIINTVLGYEDYEQYAFFYLQQKKEFLKNE